MGIRESASKKEGKVIIYGTVEKEEFSGWKKAFEEKHPCIEVDYRREYVYGTPPPMAKKIMSEIKDGAETADLVIASVPPVMQMKDLGILRKYKSPEATAYPKEIRQKDGFWTPIIAIPIVQIYNPNLVKKSELPKSASDLTNPKWKSRLVIHDITLGTLGCHWLLSLRPILGDEIWEKFARGLARNKPKSYPLYDDIMDSVADGETKIGVTILLHDFVKARDSKRSVARLKLRDVPLLASYSAVGITAAAKHPSSAEMLVDYLLSREGQEKIGSTHVRIPARTGIDCPYSLNKIVSDETPTLFPRKELMSDVDQTLPFLTRLFG